MALSLLAIALAAGLSSCAPEEKIVRYKPYFAGLEGAKFGQQPVVDESRSQAVLPPKEGSGGGEKIVIEHEDGTVTLISKSPRHVMIHLEKYLDADEDDVLLEQVISEETIEHYRKEGKDPREYVQELKAARKDIAIFFARLPAAEHTPSAVVDQVGNKTWVIRLNGKAGEGLRYTRLWVRQEHGSWRLLWLS